MLHPSWQVLDVSQNVERMPCVNSIDENFVCVTSGTWRNLAVYSLMSNNMQFLHSLSQRIISRPGGQYWHRHRARLLTGTLCFVFAAVSYSSRTLAGQVLKK